MRLFGRFYRDRSGFVGADFALMVALVFAARYTALCHGSEIAALIRPIFGA
jgi:hypothetical protein